MTTRCGLLLALPGNSLKGNGGRHRLPRRMAAKGRLRSIRIRSAIGSSGWEAVIRRDELERPRCAVGRRPIAGRSLVPRRHPKPFPIPDLSAVTAERGGSTSTDLPRSGAEASVFLRFGIDRSASRPELERPPKMG